LNYKELVVWQKAHILATKIIRYYDSTKQSYTGDIIAKQLIRAVTSIGANIAEGYGRHEGKEYLHFLLIAYGSANETDNWLYVLKDSGKIQDKVAIEFLNDTEEIQKILGSIIKRMKEKGK
jgi:four helix bundle protein